MTTEEVKQEAVLEDLSLQEKYDKENGYDGEDPDVINLRIYVHRSKEDGTHDFTDEQMVEYATRVRHVLVKYGAYPETTFEVMTNIRRENNLPEFKQEDEENADE